MNGNDNAKKRSLILAGGGIKVAFQAGVMQVWLDEAELKFDHVDAASGGVFNLAMLCQGMTGTQIADNWRNIDPRSSISFNYSELPKLAYAESMFTLDAFRENVFPTWGLDWEKIRTSDLNATFNVTNFSKKEIEVIEPREMTEQMLSACVSLPMWFPPQQINGQTYIDAVYQTDANIEEAIRRGADELWVIWTVSDKDEWHSGFVATYFQIIETAAVGNYRSILKRIARNNEEIASGKAGEFGRHIEVKELKADVPLHYLINFSKDRVAEAVNLGVKRAREWCGDQGITLNRSTTDYPLDIHEAHTKISFTEEMKGFATFGASDYEDGYRQGKENGTALMFHLSMVIDGVNRFVTQPEHDTSEIVGYVEYEKLGGRLPVEAGTFNLIVDQADSSVKHMYYRLFFKDSGGSPITLSGFKVIKDDPGFDFWSDTTTLYTTLLRGHVSVEEEKRLRTRPADLADAQIAVGIIHIYLQDFLKQLTTFRAEGPTFSDRMAALTRFGRLFFGKMWDVYAKDVLTSGPI
ncbi:MAG: patatin-like phospholipase family protein [Pyrinomonadaceae bacterium]